jgi:AAA domain
MSDDVSGSSPWERGEQQRKAYMRTQLPRPAAPAALPPVRPRRMTLETVSSGVKRAPFRVFLYGDGGLGKSTFFAESPDAIFLDTQDGTANIAGAKRFPRTPETWEDVLEAIDELLSKDYPYKTFVIDIIDDVERMIWAHICQRDKKENIESYGFNKGPTVALVEWRQLIAKLERLRREKQMNIGLVGHMAVCKFKNPESEDYGMFGPQIDAKASGLIRGWCDTVLFARQETFTKTDKNTNRTRAWSTGTRLLYTNSTAAYYAKNRDNLPDVIDLDWGVYAAAVEAGQPASLDAIRAELAELMTKIDDEELLTAVKEQIVISGEDAARLTRVLHKLRERLQPQQEGAQ